MKHAQKNMICTALSEACYLYANYDTHRICTALSHCKSVLKGTNGLENVIPPLYAKMLQEKSNVIFFACS